MSMGMCISAWTRSFIPACRSRALAHRRTLRDSQRQPNHRFASGGRRQDPESLRHHPIGRSGPARKSARSRICARHFARRHAKWATSSKRRRPSSGAVEGESPRLPRRHRHRRKSTSVPARSPVTTTASASTRQTSRGAFIGSDSQLVAPVTVGATPISVGDHSTKDVPGGALAVARVSSGISRAGSRGSGSCSSALAPPLNVNASWQKSNTMCGSSATSDTRTS